MFFDQGVTVNVLRSIEKNMRSTENISRDLKHVLGFWQAVQKNVRLMRQFNDSWLSKSQASWRSRT